MIEIINGDCIEQMGLIIDNSVDAVVTDPPYGLSFMGKHWDYDVPNVDVWREVYRVLKPGGYLLSFGGTRTYHRMACAIEDAGFEIRDMVEWLYGSGFPKSLDIGKAVDKLRGNEREITGERRVTESDLGQKSGWNYLDTSSGKYVYTKGTSEWEGWGSALKPAHEPICMARKPLSEKTVAENVLKHGTGGINIDGCRVETTEVLKGGQYSGTERKDANCYGRHKNLPKEDYVQPQGRFPANVIHDGSEVVVREFPHGGAAAPVSRGMNGKSKGIYGDFAQKGDDGATFYNDNGSAARFFYCAKASKSERNTGCEDMPYTRHADRKADDRIGGDNPRNRTNNSKQNFHPTVKPVALMRYLCRMVTPKGGIVLDPFMGSGTTGIAAKVEGYSFIGIEREEEYCRIAEARIAGWEEEKPEVDLQQKLF